MSEKLKRLQVSIPSDLEEELRRIKRERYGGASDNEMMRDLLDRGLQTLKREAGEPAEDSPV